jgi:hypothetical protein
MYFGVLVPILIIPDSVKCIYFECASLQVVLGFLPPFMYVAFSLLHYNIFASIYDSDS